MVAANWISEHWFELFQTVGIVGSFLITAYAVWRNEQTIKTGNSIAIYEQYNQLWREYDERPELGRILEKDADLTSQPPSNQEFGWVKRLLLFLDIVRRAGDAGLFVKIEGLRKDAGDFLERPIPKSVWEKIKPFQNEAYVEFVETILKNNGRRSN